MLIAAGYSLPPHAGAQGVRSSGETDNRLTYPEGIGVAPVAPAEPLETVDIEWITMPEIVIPSEWNEKRASRSPADTSGRAAVTSTWTSGVTEMELLLNERLCNRPKDASTWRMLGKLRRQRGALHEAYESLLIAVKLDPLNVAAHFDLGSMLLDMGRADEAIEHFHRVVDLAPDSEYARQARELSGGRVTTADIAVLDDPVDEPELTQAGYETTELNGTDPFAKELFRDDPPPPVPSRLPLYFRLEAGSLYNSNVSLAPLSRELSPESSASVQGYLAPELEVYLFDRDSFRTGPTLQGYFSFNEGDFRQYNVQDYQPGYFLQWFVYHDVATFEPRIDYTFLHDEFDGTTFGNRHALTSSLVARWKNDQKSVAYWSVDNTNYTDDGSTPEITSRDGWVYGLGFNHKWLLRMRHLDFVRVGIDGQLADLDGSDYAYDGISLYGDAEVPLAWACSWYVRGGWGFRDYYAYEFAPSRDENIWQVATELRRQITDWMRIAAVFRYSRFDSDNVLFEAERTIAGVVTTIEY